MTERPPAGVRPAPIRVGHIDLSFHDASAREVETILEGHGLSVVRSAAAHEEMFRRLGRGEVDVLVSAWLPASHGRYVDPIASEVREVCTLYEPYCIWGVPDYIPEDEVLAIPDLLGPTALARMDRLLQGINAGAGISRFSKRMIEAYGLAEAGYHFETGTEEDCFGRFEQAFAERRWVVIPLWHPQALHNRYQLRALADPLGLLGGRDQARLLVRCDAQARIGKAPLADLARLTLGNAEVSRLDDQLRSGRNLPTQEVERRK